MKEMRKFILILLTLTIATGVVYSQAPIKRKKSDKTEQTQSSTQRSDSQQGHKHNSSSVKISEPDGYINGHGYVDLGLPSGTKWATCNIGASYLSDYGSYFAWGEIQTKSSYSESNSFMGGRYMPDSVLINEKIIEQTRNLTTTHDAAYNQWGTTWKIPSSNEFKELEKKCKWEWLKVDGHYGYKVTGPNGKSIFLPAAGVFINEIINEKEEMGEYWTSTNWSEWYVVCLTIRNKNYKYEKVRQNSVMRHGGRSIRPILNR